MLNKHSDDNKALTTNDIIKRLGDMGIHCERKTLYEDIKCLNEHGYEVMANRGRSNSYYIADKHFDTVESKMMMDAIQSANFITHSRTHNILNKIADLSGESNSKLLIDNCLEFGENKTLNARTYYAISTIDQAISNGKKVSFQYYSYDERCKKVYRKEGARYFVTPIAFIFNDSKYYLLTHSEKYESITPYRIDKMDNVLEETEHNCKEIISKYNNSELRRQTFNMFVGEEINCKIQIEKSLIDVIVDKFGENIKFYPTQDNKLQFEVIVQNSLAFVSWCTKFGKNLKVLAPECVIKDINEVIDELCEIYKK